MHSKRRSIKECRANPRRMRCFVVDDELWEKVRIAAHLNGVNVSVWARRVFTEAFSRQVRRKLSAPADAQIPPSLYPDSGGQP